jgi:hypothetical protein
LAQRPAIGGPGEKRGQAKKKIPGPWGLDKAGFRRYKTRFTCKWSGEEDD